MPECSHTKMDVVNLLNPEKMVCYHVFISKKKIGSL